MNTPTSKKTPICPKTSILQKYTRLSGFSRVFTGYITGLLGIKGDLALMAIAEYEGHDASCVFS